MDVNEDRICACVKTETMFVKIWEQCNDLVQHSMYVIVQLNTSLGRYIKAWMMYGDIQ